MSRRCSIWVTRSKLLEDSRDSWASRRTRKHPCHADLLPAAVRSSQAVRAGRSQTHGCGRLLADGSTQRSSRGSKGFYECVPTLFYSKSAGGENGRHYFGPSLLRAAGGASHRSASQMRSPSLQSDSESPGRREQSSRHPVLPPEDAASAVAYVWRGKEPEYPAPRRARSSRTRPYMPSRRTNERVAPRRSVRERRASVWHSGEERCRRESSI